MASQYVDKLRRSVVFVLLLFGILQGLPASSADDLRPAFSEIRRTLVLLDNHGSDTGAGIVVDSNLEGSTILTDAHVITADDGSVGPVSVYQPPSTIPIASNIRISKMDVDADDDLAIIHMPVPSLPIACIRETPPLPGTAIGLAAFTLKPFEISDLGRAIYPHAKLADVVPHIYPIVREGLISGSDDRETEFFAAVEQGFSGGPIFERDTGFVFGLLQRRLRLDSAPTGNTLVTVTGQPLQAFLRKRLPIELLRPYGESSRNVLTSRHDRIVILGSTIAALNVQPSDQSFAFTFLDVLDVFKGATLVVRAEEGVQTAHSSGPSFAMPRVDTAIGYQSLCDSESANTVLRIAEVTTNQRAVANVEIRACDGRLLRAFVTDPVPVQSDPMVMAVLLRDSIKRAMNQQISVSERVNFAKFGFLIGDGEHDIGGYFSTTIDGHLAVVSLDQEGPLFAAGVRESDVVVSAGETGGKRLVGGALTVSNMQKLINRSAGSVDLAMQDGKRATVRPENICGMLEREIVRGTFVPKPVRTQAR